MTLFNLFNRTARNSDKRTQLQFLRELVSASTNQTDLLNRKLDGVAIGIANQTDLLSHKLDQLIVGVANQSDLLNRRMDHLIGEVSNQTDLLNRRMDHLIGEIAKSVEFLQLAVKGPDNQNQQRDIVQFDGAQPPRRPKRIIADDVRPLVSVILACYNQERFVAEAVEGILAQTYRPLEIVIFDDCSQDGTAAVIESKLAEFPDRSDVRFIRNQRNMTARGVCESGFAATQGDFVIIGCGDDIWFPNMVSEFVKTWLEEGVSLVAPNAIYIDEDSNLLNRAFRDPDGRADDSFETLATDGGNACCFGPALGLERELYTKFGWPPAYLEAVDIMLPFYAYLLNGARFIDKPLLKYRVHSGNTSLSLALERTQGIEHLKVRERDYYLHLAHALFMQDELSRVSAAEPELYSGLQARIAPLLNIQAQEAARKLIRTRNELNEASRSARGGE